MSYINYIRDFWSYRESYPLGSRAADLYLFLLDECNRQRWVNPLAVPTALLQSRLGMNKSRIVDARNELQAAGLIDFEKGCGKKSAPSYLLKRVSTTEPLVTLCYRYLDLLVTLCDRLTGLLVTLRYQYGNTMLPMAKENTPTPPKENIYNITRQSSYDDNAGAGALTREGLDFFQTKCLDPLFREKGERACAGVADAYESLCMEILTDWAAVGEPIMTTPDVCRHFLATLRKKAETLRQQRACVMATSIHKRKARFMQEIKAIRDSAGTGGYDRALLNDFFRYYTQPTPDGTMLAFETKPFWDTKTRLDQWIRQENSRSR